MRVNDLLVDLIHFSSSHIHTLYRMNERENCTKAIEKIRPLNKMKVRQYKEIR